MVDDRPANLLALEALLEPLGARTVRAATGREALQRAAEEDFAAILLDLRLPDLSGLEVTVRLREQGLNQRTPVLLLTAGDVGEEELLRGYAHGAVDFLRKPLVPAVLQAKVSVFLELHVAREALRASEREATESRHRALLGNLLLQAPAAIAILRGPELVFEFANPVYEQVVGRTGLVGRPLLQALPELAGQRAVLQALEGVLRTGEPFRASDFPVQLARGGPGAPPEQVYFNFIYQAMRGPSGEVEGLIAFAVDVTDQVRARRQTESLAEDLRQQAQALRASEERLQLALESTALGTWDMDMDTLHELRWDARCKQLFGLPPDAHVDYDVFLSGLHPEDRAATHAAIQEALRPGGPGHFDVEYRTVGLQDGQLRWVRATGRARFEGGTLARFTGTVLDISRRKRIDEERAQAAAENARLLQAVSAERQNLQSLLMQMPVSATVLRGPTLLHEMSNPAAERLRGRALPSGVPIRELLPELEGQGFYELLERVYRTGETVEAREMRARWRRTEEGALEEGIFDISYQPLRDAAGRIDGVVSYSMDVTAQVQARERVEALAAALQQSEGRFRVLAEAMPQLAWSADAGGEHDYFNQRFREYTGAPPDRADTATWQQSMHPEDRPRALERWRRSVETGEPFEVEYRRLRSDGQWRWLLGRALPARDAEGHITRWLGTSTDIEEQVRTLRELEAAQAEVRRLNAGLEQRVAERTHQLQEVNRELESFSYSVSHDLRAPLRHVTGFAQLLQKRAGSQLDETSRGYLKTIFDAAQQGGTLVDDLLAFSRMGRAALRPARVELRALVDEVVRELAPDARGRQVEWRVGALPEVHADPAMLRQVLRNLLANALKYTRPRERAVIEVGAEPLGAGNLETHVWVKDNGVGFEMQYVDKLFGVFQRLHTADQFEGTGIGLANVKRVVSRHGGRAWAEGAPDQGATFHFTLPHTPAPGASRGTHP
nr:MULTISPECIES: PAS domain-containing protein [Myxococcaceae]